MQKYYKVIKENPLWEVGAILENSADSGGGYKAIDDVFNKHDETDNEYLSCNIVENAPEFFSRVYKVSLATQVVYEVREKAKELISRSYKEDEV